MGSPYKRRRPSILRNFWIYRRLVGLAVVLGLILWFIWANDAAVSVAFPFGLGEWKSTLGFVILISALVGAVATGLTMTMVYAWKRVYPHQPSAVEDDNPLPDDRPPADYASKASELPPGQEWP